MQEPMDHFEAALLTELRGHVATRTTRPRQALARVGILAGTALALTAIGVLAASPWQSTPAFAVGPGPDGVVKVSIERLEDAEGLHDALAAVGVDSVVTYNKRVTHIDYRVSEDAGEGCEFGGITSTIGAAGVAFDLPADLVASDAVLHIALAGNIEPDGVVTAVIGWTGGDC